MPSWNIHLEIAKRLNNKLNYNNEDYKLFMIGNILPDINNSFVVKGISKMIPHKYTHYTEDNFYSYKNFYKEYKEKMKNPLILGYYVHLYSDFIWNNNFYSNIPDEYKNMDKIKLRVLKQNDFRKFNNNYLSNRIDKDTNLLIDKINIVDRISVNKYDIDLVVNYLENRREEKLDYVYYTEDKLNELLNETVSIIEKEI